MEEVVRPPGDFVMGVGQSRHARGHRRVRGGAGGCVGMRGGARAHDGHTTSARQMSVRQCAEEMRRLYEFSATKP